MRTLLPDPHPADVQAMLERRHRLGQDRRDEVWEGVYRMAPAPSGEHATLTAQVTRLLAPAADAVDLTVSMDFNLGNSKHDYRIPDGGLHRSPPHGAWIPTAALALEVLSPGDDTWDKLPFYAAHHVDELLILDPATRTIHWLGLAGDRYDPIEQSNLIDLGPGRLAEQIGWL